MRVRRTGDEMAMDLPRRKNIRLKGYDYGQSGVYFITLCVKDRHNLLWENDTGIGALLACSLLSDTGRVVDTAINNIYKI